MLPVREIEKYVKEETKQVESVVHDFSHLKRTAIGAVWFVKVLGGSKHEQDLAYIAGLLHDIVRPASENICHAQASADKSREIISRFNINEEDKERIIEAITSHREKHKWTDALHQSVFLADKIFEQMGAFVIFRRAMFAGECKDYKKIAFEKAITEHFKKRLEKFSTDDFHKRFIKLVKYQYRWIDNFTTSLMNSEKWALDIAYYAFDSGKKKKNLNKIIEKYRPMTKDQKRIRKETIAYIKGKKFKEFERLIENG